MKRMLVLLVVIFLSGCSIEINVQEVEEYWDEIEGVEFANFDVFAGHGLYFYTEAGTPYCKYMKYGSGVPVIFEIDSEIEFVEEKMIIKLPENVLGPWDDGNDGYFEFELTYDDGNIVWDDMIFVETDITCHDGC